MTTTVGVVSNYESAVFLVEDNSDRESVATIIDSLLASVCSSRPEDLSDSILKDIANFLRKEAAMNPSVQNIFLKHFPNLPKPVPFITIVPYIFCSASPQIRNDVIIQLFNLADTNSMFLLPALSALIEFPLSTQAVHQLSDYVSEYADTINKEDLTTFFKVVIKANSHIEVEETITKIRRKVSYTILQ